MKTKIIAVSYRSLILVFEILIASCSIHPNKLGIVAHRGANHLAPENTMAAAQKCVDLDVDYVEIDVRMSKDGIFYILHDRTLDRTTNGTGAIKDRLSFYIDTLDAGSWFSPEFEGEKVPRLKLFLNEFKDKIKIYFDVKDADLSRLVNLVYKTGFEKDCFFGFSKDSMAKELRDLDKSLGLKMSAQNVDGLEKAMEYQPQIIEYHLEHLTPAFVEFCRKNNLKLMAHALEEGSEKKYHEIIHSPADMVNLNKADLMLNLIK
jgi:glycerophosphoryl diester phosphodiesterase